MALLPLVASVAVAKVVVVLVVCQNDLGHQEALYHLQNPAVGREVSSLTLARLVQLAVESPAEAEAGNWVE